MLRRVGEKFCFLGQQVDVTTALWIFAIVGIAFNGPLPSVEHHNGSNAQHFSLGTDRTFALSDFVFSLMYNLLSLLSLLLLLADGMFGFMRRWPQFGIWAVIITVVGAGTSAFLRCKIGRPATSFPYDCATLMFVVAHSLMFVSLHLKQAGRAWLSDLMAGVAYASVALVILGYINSLLLTLEYACVLISTLFVFVLYTQVVRNWVGNPNRYGYGLWRWRSRSRRILIRC